MAMSFENTTLIVSNAPGIAGGAALSFTSLLDLRLLLP